MSILFIPAGPLEWGSSRMRAWWPSNYMDDCMVKQPGNFQIEPRIDTVIFQKVIDTRGAHALRDAGKTVYWDVCDPSWWWAPGECRAMADTVTGVVASSKALAEDFNQWYGSDLAVCIPDRLERSHFPDRMRPAHRHQEQVKFVWFGVSVNRIAIFAALANLERLAANGLNISLTIMDDRPDQPFQVSDSFPVYHTRWTLDREVQIIAGHDIALLPPYPGPWGKVKSDNKMLTAAACGVPVSDGQDYERLAELATSALARTEWVVDALSLLWQVWDVRQSAADWQELIDAHS